MSNRPKNAPTPEEQREMLKGFDNDYLILLLDLVVHSTDTNIVADREYAYQNFELIKNEILTRLNKS